MLISTFFSYFFFFHIWVVSFLFIINKAITQILPLLQMKFCAQGISNKHELMIFCLFLGGGAFYCLSHELSSSSSRLSRTHLQTFSLHGLEESWSAWYSHCPCCCKSWRYYSSFFYLIFRLIKCLKIWSCKSHLYCIRTIWPFNHFPPLLQSFNLTGRYSRRIECRMLDNSTCKDWKPRWIEWKGLLIRKCALREKVVNMSLSTPPPIYSFTNRSVQIYET